MKGNRIKWNEEMGSRCLKRIGYLPVDYEKRTEKQGESPKRQYNSRQPDMQNTENIHAAGVGDVIECKLVVM